MLRWRDHPHGISVLQRISKFLRCLLKNKIVYTVSVKKHSQKIADSERKIFDSICGWGGALVILVAYFLISFSIIPAQSYWYQGLNAIGSLGLTIEALSKRDQPLTWLNGIWVLIAVVAIAQIVLVHVK